MIDYVYAVEQFKSLTSNEIRQETSALKKLLLENKISVNLLDTDEYLHILMITLSRSFIEHSSLKKDEQIAIARVHAVKLAIVFETCKKSVKYINQYHSTLQGKIKSNQVLHDACLFSTPSGDITLWRKIVSNNMPNRPSDILMRLFPVTDRIEKYTKENHIPLGRKTPIKKLIEYSKHFTYKNANKNMQAALLFFENNMPEEAFDEYLELVPKDNAIYIPDITLDCATVSDQYKYYYINKLSPSDPIAAILGKYTSCCQTIKDNGGKSAIHGITNERGGFYVIREKLTKKIVAQCWAWRGEAGELVFDSIESSLNFRTKNLRLLTDCFTVFADKLVKEHDIPCVMVGSGGSTPKEIGVLNVPDPKCPVDYNGNLDSREQRYIAHLFMPQLVNIYSKKLDKIDNNKSKIALQNSKVNWNMPSFIEFANLCITNEMNVFDYIDESYLKKSFIDKEARNYVNVILHLKFLLSQKNIDWKEIKKAIEKSSDSNIIKSLSSTLRKTVPLLRFVARSGNASLFDYFLQHGAYVDIEAEDDIATLFAESCLGKVTALQRLLKNINDEHLKKTILKKALLYSVSEKQTDMRKYLISIGADAELKQNDYVDLLHVAAEYGNVDAIEWLLQLGADIDSLDTRRKESAIYTAIFHNKIAAVSLLLKRGAKMLIIDEDGRTPLHEAVICREAKIVKCMIESGVDPNLKDAKGVTSLSYLVSDLTDGSWDNDDDYEDGGDFVTHVLNMIAYFAQHGADVDSSIDGKTCETGLLDAVKKFGNEQVGARLINLLISLGANLNATDPNGMTPLDIAVSSGREYLVELLMINGAKLNNNKLDSLNFSKNTQKQNNIYITKILQSYSNPLTRNIELVRSVIRSFLLSQYDSVKNKFSNPVFEELYKELRNMVEKDELNDNQINLVDKLKSIDKKIKQSYSDKLSYSKATTFSSDQLNPYEIFMNKHVELMDRVGIPMPVKMKTPVNDMGAVSKINSVRPHFK